MKLKIIMASTLFLSTQSIYGLENITEMALNKDLCYGKEQTNNSYNITYPKELEAEQSGFSAYINKKYKNSTELKQNKKLVDIVLNNLLFNSKEPLEDDDEAESTSMHIFGDNTISDSERDLKMEEISRTGYLKKCVKGHFVDNKGVVNKSTLYFDSFHFTDKTISFSMSNKIYKEDVKDRDPKPGESNFAGLDETGRPVYSDYVTIIKNYALISSGSTIYKSTLKNISAYEIFDKDFLFSEDFQKIYAAHFKVSNPDPLHLCEKSLAFTAKNFLSKELQNFVLTEDKKVSFVYNREIKGEFAYKVNKDHSFRSLTTKERKKLTYDDPTFTNCVNPVYIPLAELDGHYNKEKL